MVALKPNEQRILDSLVTEPKRPTDLSKELKIALPNISGYLTNLKRLKLVDYAKEDFNQRFYFTI